MDTEEIFSQNDDGLVELVSADPPAEFDRAVQTAARICPGRAITVRAGNVLSIGCGTGLYVKFDGSPISARRALPAIGWGVE